MAQRAIAFLLVALFGAFWSLWLGGFVFEILGFIGVIVLVGVVVRLIGPEKERYAWR